MHRPTLNPVSTRKLIIASLICGLLILVAGTIKLLQTTSESSASPTLLAIGVTATMSNLSVTVNDVQVTQDRTLVNVTMNGLNDASPVDGWSMLSNGQITSPTGTNDCPISADVVTCTVEFVVAVGTPTIVFTHAGEKRQWLGS